jgi:hypothetical protein
MRLAYPGEGGNTNSCTRNVRLLNPSSYLDVMQLFEIFDAWLLVFCAYALANDHLCMKDH